MNMKHAALIGGIVAAAITVYAFLTIVKPTPAAITNFDQCAAKYPILESYPEQCNTPGGQHFVHDIGDELNKAGQVKLTNLLANGQVTSPLRLTGQARGGWFFEAQFPVELRDANGTILVAAPAKAQGDWMTDGFVAFSVDLVFSQPTTATGNLIIKKDNPSGLPEHDATFRLPVRFAASP